ncbi:MAG: metallophosphoesterase family protein [Sphingorhabdus sp.]
MFGLLSRKGKKKTPLNVARVPDGMRVYAIGDIHGRKDLLKQLINQIDTDDAERGAASTLIIFLGDLVDRGPDSAGVIEKAIKLQRKRGSNVRFLMGNHEEVFLKACRKMDKKITRFFIRIGGEETILSYPISKKEYRELDMEQLSVRLPEIVPEEHLAFLESFEDQIIIGDFLFVHAGIRPDVPLPQQTTSDLRWIREDFLDHRGDFEKVVVYGHTIYNDVREKRCSLGIDTGAYESGKLTALGLEGGERWYLQT